MKKFTVIYVSHKNLMLIYLSSKNNDKKNNSCLDIIEMKDEFELEVGHRLLVESEEDEYETLDELLVAYIEKTNKFIDQLINHQKFKPTESQLNEFLEDYLQNNPYTAYGFYVDGLYPGSFVCGYKFRPGAQMLKMVCIVRNFLNN